ncbi:MAG: outer membrane beta-barrel protein [Bacteroides sp.]
MNHRAYLIIPLMALLFLLVNRGSAYAQASKTVLNRPRNEERFIRFGIGIGLNVMDFRLLNSGALSKPVLYDDSTRFWGTVNRLHPGFNVNALMRFRINNDMHVRILPGICFGQRDLTFYNIGKNGDREWEDIKMPIESSYIEMPILFCYSVPRHSNVRPYVCAGVNVKADMAAFKKLKLENKQYLRLQKFDLAYEIGFGIEFYFYYFKMAPELKWSGGFLNTLAPETAEGKEYYHSAIKSLTSQIVMFSLIFE